MRRSLSLCVGLLALSLPSAAQDAYDDAMSALATEDFALAWELAVDASGTSASYRARTAILSRAGDLVGALEMAREGLQELPGQLDLLYHATTHAVALGDAQQASLYLSRLEAAVAGAELSAEHRPAWEAVLSDYSPRVERLIGQERERGDALAAARISSLVLLAVAGAGFVTLSLRATTVSDQG